MNYPSIIKCQQLKLTLKNIKYFQFRTNKYIKYLLLTSFENIINNFF